MEDTADVHICGTCKCQFSEIEEFVQHKKACKANTINSTLSTGFKSHTTEVFGSEHSRLVPVNPLEYTSHSDLDLSSSIVETTENSKAQSHFLDQIQGPTEVVSTTGLDRVQYVGSNQNSLDASAALLQAQSAHNLQLLDSIRLQMQQLQQQHPTGTAQPLAPANSASVESEAQVPDVVHMEVVCQGSSQSESLTIPEIQQVISDASKPVPSQLSYQSVVPLLQLSNQVNADNHGPREIQVITIPGMPTSAVAHGDGDQSVSSSVPESCRVASDSSTLGATQSCKRGKYARQIAELEGAGSSGLMLESTHQHINGPNLPEAMIEHYVQKEKSPSQFTCSHPGCNYMTQYAKNVARHMALHTGLKPHACTLCNARFSRSDKLKVHMRCHTGEKPYKCNICTYKCTDSSSLKKHIRIHTNEKPYKCQFCSYASRNSSQLTLHLRTHTGDKPFMCPVCTMRFKVKSDLKRHLRLHTGERPFACHLCDVKTTIKCNLLAHIRVYHNEETMVKCEHCDYKTSSKRALKAHAKQHNGGRFHCPLLKCQFIGSDAESLRKHIETIHGDSKPLPCSHCHFVTRNKARLVQHIKKLHNSNVGGSGKCSRGGKGKVAAVILPGDPQHECPQCNLRFVRADSLRSHLRSHKSADEFSARQQGANVEEDESQSESENSEAGNAEEDGVPSEKRIRQEHEYATVRGAESCTEIKCEKMEEGKTISPTPSPCRSAPSNSLPTALTERQKLLNLLPYIENNHNTAVWDNMQNMAISDRHGDETQESSSRSQSLQLHHRTNHATSRLVVRPSESSQPSTSNQNHVRLAPVIDKIEVTAEAMNKTTNFGSSSSSSQSFTEPTGTQTVLDVVTDSSTCDNSITFDMESASSGGPDIELVCSYEAQTLPAAQSSEVNIAAPFQGHGDIYGNRPPVASVTQLASEPSTSGVQTVTLATTQVSMMRQAPPPGEPPQTSTLGPVTTLTPLSNLPTNLQTILNSLNLARGQVITVPVGQHRVHILVDTTAEGGSTSQGQSGNSSAQSVQLTGDVHNNNPAMDKNIVQVAPQSTVAQTSYGTASSLDPTQHGDSPGPVQGASASGDPPQLPLAQPLYLMSEAPDPSGSADC